jgi:geranylgeranyl transferase type-2 subunit beta
MLQVARLAPRTLGESAPRVADFIHGQRAHDGGFRDRAGRSDLYYTVFGIEALVALREDLPAPSLTAYLRSFGDGAGLDLVHAACLARAWATLPPLFREGAPVDAIAARIAAHRSADGGFAPRTGDSDGTAYALFLAVGALQDLARPLPPAPELLTALERMRADDGGYANQAGASNGLTPPTAAAATLQRQLGAPADPALARWLLARAHEEGGFFAAPGAPMPDLLSTATALHALSGRHGDLEPLREANLDFVDTLWSSRGGFFGHWADDALDCEYTYYGLLALGHLSL